MHGVVELSDRMAKRESALEGFDRLGPNPVEVLPEERGFSLGGFSTLCGAAAARKGFSRADPKPVEVLPKGRVSYQKIARYVQYLPVRYLFLCLKSCISTTSVRH
jgi:hypothetical protein